jgi:hypothetical protein
MNMIITRNLMKYFLDVIIFFGCPNRQVNDSQKEEGNIFHHHSIEYIQAEHCQIELGQLAVPKIDHIVSRSSIVLVLRFYNLTQFIMSFDKTTHKF